MSHVQVLIFETNLQNYELWKAVLNQRDRISYTGYLVPLRGGTAPPVEEYFHRKLELHRPKLLVTSWRHIGPVVRKAERTMTEPRPVEKWIVSGYTLRELDRFGAVSWADMVYEKPISPLYLAEEVERRLLSMPSSSGIIVPA